MKKLIIFSLIILALTSSCQGERTLRDLPGKDYEVGTYNIKPLTALYTTRPTSEHMLALVLAYQSLEPGDYPSDLFEVFGLNSPAMDADGTIYRPSRVYALPCFPDENKPLFDQFSSTDTCNTATRLKAIMIVYATEARPTNNLTFQVAGSQAMIVFPGPVDEVTSLH